MIGTSRPQLTVLFLAANPVDTDRLALDREARAIQQELDADEGNLHLVTRWAVEPLDLLHALRSIKPHIVHFSGHSGPEGLCLQGPDGERRIVTSQALASTFDAAGSTVQIVVLNACYSQAHAEALVHVPWVVGFSTEVDDDAARAFSMAFYRALLAGCAPEAAFGRAASLVAQWGCQPKFHERRLTP